MQYDIKLTDYCGEQQDLINIVKQSIPIEHHRYCFAHISGPKIKIRLVLNYHSVHVIRRLVDVRESSFTIWGCEQTKSLTSPNGGLTGFIPETELNNFDAMVYKWADPDALRILSEHLQTVIDRQIKLYSMFGSTGRSSYILRSDR